MARSYIPSSAFQKNTDLSPDWDAVIRLVGSLLIEIDDGWQIGRRYFSLASRKELLESDDETKLATLPIPLAPVH